MKKTLNYWIIDLLIGLIFYVTYRIAMTETTADVDGFLTTILDILNIVLNFGFSLLTLAPFCLLLYHFSESFKQGKRQLLFFIA